MDAAAAISLVLTVIRTIQEVAPIAIQGITDLKAFGTALYERFKGEKISDADLATLEAQIDALSDELNSPMPE